MTTASDSEEAPGGGPCNRRAVLASIAGLGIGTAVFQRALAQQVTASLTVTAEMIQQAEWIAGLDLAEEDRTAVAGRVQSALRQFAEMREIDVGYDVPPAMLFNPAPDNAAQCDT